MNVFNERNIPNVPKDARITTLTHLLIYAFTPNALRFTPLEIMPRFSAAGMKTIPFSANPGFQSSL